MNVRVRANKAHHNPPDLLPQTGFRLLFSSSLVFCSSSLLVAAATCGESRCSGRQPKGKLVTSGKRRRTENSDGAAGMADEAWVGGEFSVFSFGYRREGQMVEAREGRRDQPAEPLVRFVTFCLNSVRALTEPRGTRRATWAVDRFQFAVGAEELSHRSALLADSATSVTINPPPTSKPEDSTSKPRACYPIETSRNQNIRPGDHLPPRV